MLCDNLSVSGSTLYFAGMNASDLAGEFGTPLYLMDEDRIRLNCRRFKRAVGKLFPDGSDVLYASKAASYRKIYRILSEEGLCADVVSPGEIHTACSAGFDMSRVYFQGNSKSDSDIIYALENGVGHFVVDSMEELLSLDAIAGARGETADILLRLTPGIDCHTYEAINTGKVDSKFGAAIETGQALEITRKALELGNVHLEGFHCHVGSQVFEENVFERSSSIMLGFIAYVKETLGYEADVLDLGGGFGVRYMDDDPYVDIEAKLSSIASSICTRCSELSVKVPSILFEPGRSIVADAGLTLYKVGTVKRIPGYKNYVSVDGGMTDNPRFALYHAKYSVFAATKMDEVPSFECSLVGKCCESGDIIQEHVLLPESIVRGDIIAVCTTGAYNYSMASNYNRIPRPPVVMLRGGKTEIAVRRETLEDLCTLDT